MDFPKAPTPSEVKDAADQALDDGVDALEEITDTVVTAVQNAGNDAGSNSGGGALSGHDAVRSGVRNARAILQTVDSFVNSISDIAAGNIRDVAAHTEHALAGLTVVLIGFLGSFLGLGSVGGRVQSAVRRVQTAVDRVIGWGAGHTVNLAGGARDRLLPYATALRDLAQHAGSGAEHSRAQVIHVLERLNLQARPDKKEAPSNGPAASEPVDVKRAEAMLARLPRIERSLHKVEMAMSLKGARFTTETAALLRLRNALIRRRQHLTAQLTAARVTQPRIGPPPGLRRR